MSTFEPAIMGCFIATDVVIKTSLQVGVSWLDESFRTISSTEITLN